jgi:hypothetical protein
MYRQALPAVQSPASYGLAPWELVVYRSLVSLAERSQIEISWEIGPLAPAI